MFQGARVKITNKNNGFERAGLRFNYLEGLEGIVKDYRVYAEGYGLNDTNIEVFVPKANMSFRLNEDCLEVIE